MSWVHEPALNSLNNRLFLAAFFPGFACKIDLLILINLPDKKHNKETLPKLKLFKISNFPLDIYPSHTGRKNCPAGMLEDSKKEEIMFPTWLNWPNNFMSPFGPLKHLIAKAHIHYIDVFSFLQRRWTQLEDRNLWPECPTLLLLI